MYRGIALLFHLEANTIKDNMLKRLTLALSPNVSRAQVATKPRGSVAHGNVTDKIFSSIVDIP